MADAASTPVLARMKEIEVEFWDDANEVGLASAVHRLCRALAWYECADSGMYGDWRDNQSGTGGNYGE